MLHAHPNMARQQWRFRNFSKTSYVLALDTQSFDHQNIPVIFIA
ncbi:hypothetical protein CEV34_4964 [Brucella pseudogrignonensis]|uniref:Uncharacterized protein n=1 Tax=Brucella pseudogrignonensis TaxID=419475 RepID=A0A256G446_9HYPH|nr:hypothetical protein CEV34_4964 [Brucella pseudogrignonensis]